jgi:hypothetical protein
LQVCSAMHWRAAFLDPDLAVEMQTRCPGSQ